MLSVSLTAYLTARQGRTHKMKSVIVIVPGLMFSGLNGSKKQKVVVFYQSCPAPTTSLPVVVWTNQNYHTLFYIKFFLLLELRAVLLLTQINLHSIVGSFCCCTRYVLINHHSLAFSSVYIFTDVHFFSAKVSYIFEHCMYHFVVGYYFYYYFYYFCFICFFVKYSLYRWK